MEVFLSMAAIIFGLTLGVEKTEIVLLDSDKPSAIEVNTKDINSTLDVPNSFVGISNISSAKQTTLSDDEINDRYGNLIKAGVKPAISYLLYFTEGDSLDDASLAKLDEIKATIKKRKPCAVSIIGHTDTVGSDKLNEKLSLKRAQRVSEIFKNEEMVKMEVLSFGEKDLLIKTADNVFEPKNRRVEIQIR
ncbi:MAG: OmpA family protein [Campylobacteraceae bacterium]|nr:OmpA family protein [Campylobacteraceae bacterium]